MTGNTATEEAPVYGPHNERRAHPGDSRTVIALSERVAVIESHQRELSRDVRELRVGQQAMSETSTKSLAVNTEILALARDLPNIASQVTAFNEMKVDLKETLDERQRRAGGRGALLIIGSFSVGLAAVGGALTTGFYSLLGHFK